MAKIQAKVIEVTCRYPAGTRLQGSDRTYEVQANGEWRRVA